MGSSRFASSRARISTALPALLAAALIGCSTPVPSNDTETVGNGRTADVQQVVAAHRSLVHAYESADVTAFMGLLDASAEVLIFHPRIESWFDNRDGMRKGMAAMFARMGECDVTEAHNRVAVHGDIAWHTALMAVEASGLDEPFVGRSTEIWRRGPAGWRVVHGHWSEHPGSDRTGESGW